MSTDLSSFDSAGGVRRWLPWVLVGVAAVALVFFVATGNRLVGLNENVNTSWAQVETVLQRRFDLIPNLVNTVKGYATHEREVLEKVTELRSRWSQAESQSQRAEIASELEGTLSRLLLVAENYPDLKANQQFRDLQVELAGTENRVSVERQRYNESVRAFNTAIQQFPTSVVARLRNMSEPRAYFEAAPAAAEAPRVDFSPAGA